MHCLFSFFYIICRSTQSIYTTYINTNFFFAPNMFCHFLLIWIVIFVCFVKKMSLFLYCKKNFWWLRTQIGSFEKRTTLASIEWHTLTQKTAMCICLLYCFDFVDLHAYTHKHWIYSKCRYISIWSNYRVDGSTHSDWYIEATGRRRSSGKEYYVGMDLNFYQLIPHPICCMLILYCCFEF